MVLSRLKQAAVKGFAVPHLLDKARQEDVPGIPPTKDSALLRALNLSSSDDVVRAAGAKAVDLVKNHRPGNLADAEGLALLAYQRSGGSQTGVQVMVDLGVAMAHHTGGSQVDYYVSNVVGRGARPHAPEILSGIYDTAALEKAPSAMLFVIARRQQDMVTQDQMQGMATRQEIMISGSGDAVLP